LNDMLASTTSAKPPPPQPRSSSSSTRVSNQRQHHAVCDHVSSPHQQHSFRLAATPLFSFTSPQETTLGTPTVLLLVDASVTVDVITAQMGMAARRLSVCI
jgi:hypothetical protein